MIASGQSREALADRLLSLASPATVLLGTQLLDLDEAAGTARFGFVGRPEFVNVLGTVQGGFVAAMLDETAGLTARLIASDPIAVPTLDFRVSFLRPVLPGELFGIGRAIRAGRRIAFMEADLLAEDGTLLSRMSLTALAKNGASAT